ncbi:cell division protein FtsQ/DivIB [Paenibacillus sp. y28]|uniref:cell division protein FtsQ/DivIB n=1 Tax=Paenibacillus sp. y28 TaxID=3129110 RepID=UPI0030178E05
MSTAYDKVPALTKQTKTKSRSSRRLLVFLLMFFIILLFVLFFRSSISRIAIIEVSGNSALTTDEIVQASGVKEGDHFLAVRSTVIMQRVKALPAVKSAEVSKDFPGHIRIIIEEFPRVAYQISPEGKTEAVLSSGWSYPLDNYAPIDKPIISGWNEEDPWRKKLCAALTALTPVQLSYISEIRPAPTNSYPDKIKMYVRANYEVYTTVTKLPDKMKTLDDIIEDLKKKQITSGVLELLEVDVHRSFDLFYQK